MQTRGTFPGLYGNQRLGQTVKPASNSRNTTRALEQTDRQTAIAPPKRRRQLTAKPAQTGNPFAALQGLVGKALKGK